SNENPRKPGRTRPTVVGPTLTVGPLACAAVCAAAACSDVCAAPGAEAASERHTAITATVTSARAATMIFNALCPRHRTPTTRLYLCAASCEPVGRSPVAS